MYDREIYLKGQMLYSMGKHNIIRLKKLGENKINVMSLERKYIVLKNSRFSLKYLLHPVLIGQYNIGIEIGFLRSTSLEIFFKCRKKKCGKNIYF